jgi:hypothetical protein
MTFYAKSEIRAGIFMEKDCPIVVVKPTSTVPLSEIHAKLERVRKKIAVLAQVVAANRTRH